MLPICESGHVSERKMLIFNLSDSSKSSLFYITKGDIVKCRHLQHLIVIPGYDCCSGSVQCCSTNNSIHQCPRSINEASEI